MAERTHGFKENGTEPKRGAFDIGTGAAMTVEFMGPRAGDTGDAGKMQCDYQNTNNNRCGQPAEWLADGGTADTCRPPAGVWNTVPNVGADGDDDAATNLMMSESEKRGRVTIKCSRAHHAKHTPEASTGKEDDTLALLPPKTRSSSRRFRAPSKDISSFDLIKECIVSIFVERAA
jgi:hypothetical protein